MKSTMEASLVLTSFPTGLALSSLPGHMKIKAEPRDENGQPGRKRQRLDHLTVEEKMMRRKLKNRVAAQSARDRKKVQMDQLEDEVAILKSEMASLRAENARLQVENSVFQEESFQFKAKLQKIEELQQENVRLRQQLKEQEERVQKSSVVNHSNDGDQKSIEYASLISVSQQKRQDSTVAARWMMLFIGWTMLNLMKSSTSYKNLKKSSLQKVFQLIPLEMWRKIQKPNPQMKWWGPQQSSWNPSKN